MNYQNNADIESTRYNNQYYRYDNLYHYPAYGNAVVPPPHPQDFGLRIPPEYNKFNRKFTTPIYPYQAAE